MVATATSQPDYPAVIFDLDGTLLDTIDDLATSMNEVLLRHGFPEHPISQYKYMVGDGLEMLVNRALPAKAPRPTQASCLGDMKKTYGRHWHDLTRPYEGIIPLLHELKARQIRMAVQSNKAHEFTSAMVSHYFQRDFFEIVMGARADLPRKPDPTGARQIAHTFNLSPDRIAFVGDTRIDIETAHEAGMLAIGVKWGFRTEDELRQSKAHHIISHPSEILDILCRRPTP